jgi:hypothetical protein
MILFQTDYFEDELPLWEAVGAKCITGLCRDEDITEFGPIIPRGTIAFFNSVKFSLRNKGYPDITWPFNNNWNRYSYLSWTSCDDLLNNDFKTFYGFEDLKKHIKINGPRWVRSNSGSKIFTGGVFDLESIIVEEEYFKQHGGTNVEFVAASPKQIDKEWRLIIVGGEIVCSSMYMYKGEPNEKRGAPNNLLLFAEGWVKKHAHLFVHSYTMDICDSGGRYFLVEVNNLLTSGWYFADKEKIINKIVNIKK